MTPYSLWILMILVVMLSSINSTTKTIPHSPHWNYIQRIPNTILFTFAILLMILYSSNTIANDVLAYRINYSRIITNTTFSDFWEKGIGANPSFGYFQYLVKTYISTSPAVFQLICAIIVQTLFMLFYRRYSPSLSMSVFMYIASGLFFFTIVSWKQSLAMSIGLTATTFIIKREYVYYVLILLATMTIHPYILMYAFLPVLINERVWTKKNIIILLIMCIVGYSLSSVLDTALDVTEEIFGDRHDAQWFDSANGVSLPRVIFFAITPFLSWIYRKRLDAKPYPLMNGFIQMSVISFGFMVISLSGGTNFITRMATYFEPFTYVALPFIILNIVPDKYRSIVKYAIISVFIVFFCFLQLKRGSLF